VEKVDKVEKAAKEEKAETAEKDSSPEKKKKTDDPVDDEIAMFGEKKRKRKARLSVKS